MEFTESIYFSLALVFSWFFVFNHESIEFTEMFNFLFVLVFSWFLVFDLFKNKTIIL